jgi:hypothetical protein
MISRVIVYTPYDLPHIAPFAKLDRIGTSRCGLNDDKIRVKMAQAG